jgi:NADPH:quinone reductase-like Zn-dependent oxidoreductase
LRYLYSRNLSLLGSYMGSRSELFTVLKLVAEGKLKPIIDRVLPLADCRKAHELLENREQFGKIVLQV